MTAYTETIGKNSKWGGSYQMQTGLLPALPAIGAAIPSLGGIGGTLAGIGSSLGLGAIGTKLGSMLSKGASKAGSGLGGGTASGLAKLGLGTAAISQINKFMNSGPSVAGVNILPAAVIGGGILIAGKMILG